MNSANWMGEPGRGHAGAALDLADHGGILQQRVHVAVHLGHDLERRARGCREARPAGGVEARQGVGDRRDEVERRRGAARRGERQRLDALVGDRAQRRRGAVHHQLDVAAQQVGHRRPAALVGDVHDVELGAHLEEFHGQMLRRARPGRGVGQLARLLAGELDQLAERVRREARMRHDHQRHQEDVGDRQEVDQRPVRQVGIEAGIDAEGAARDDHQRVAVGCRVLAVLGGGNAAAARLVLDHDLLLPHVGQLLGHQAGEDVGGLAGRERHDEAHRLGGPRRLRQGGRGQRRPCNACQAHRLPARGVTPHKNSSTAFEL